MTTESGNIRRMKKAKAQRPERNLTRPADGEETKSFNNPSQRQETKGETNANELKNTLHFDLQREQPHNNRGTK